jgi:hypothetical protein
LLFLKDYKFEIGAFFIGSISFSLLLPKKIITSQFYKKNLYCKNRKKRKIVEKYVIPLGCGIVGGFSGLLISKVVRILPLNTNEK